MRHDNSESKLVNREKTNEKRHSNLYNIKDHVDKFPTKSFSIARRKAKTQKSQVITTITDYYYDMAVDVLRNFTYSIDHPEEKKTMYSPSPLCL